MSAQERLRDFAAAGQSAQASGLGTDASGRPHEIKIGKTAVSTKADGSAVLTEVFTMTIGEETIELLPLKNWAQLDIFKWRARGVLPRTPAGLEITRDQLKVAGETVSTWNSDACARLEKAFNEWLVLEKRTLEATKEKARPPIAQTSAPRPFEEDKAHFELELNHTDQPRIKYLEGNETVKVVALNLHGLNALIEQGLMRRPQSMKAGALHNWVELDGKVFHFKENANAAKELERAFNEQYLAAANPDASPDVAVYPNPASPTGFDIQFPASPKGLVENRKWHLNEETVHLLQDPERCHVLRKGITARLVPPELVFKVKTPGGAERYLNAGLQNTVSVVGKDGQTKTIDLSHPVNLLQLGAGELTAIFNHPAINRRARLVEAARLRNNQSG
jgi:hypothetical protein